MTSQPDLWSVAPTHRDDPPESTEAAQKVNGARQLALVLSVLREASEPLSDDEIAERAGLLRHSAGTRRGVAVRLGWVVKAGRGKTPLGNACSTWTLTPQGREQAAGIVSRRSA